MKKYLMLALVMSGCTFAVDTQRTEPSREPPKRKVSKEDQELIRQVKLNSLFTWAPTNRPPITMDTRYISQCPYCGELNLSIATTMSGGRAVNGGTVMPHIAVPAPEDGSVEEWNISYTCSQCNMSYSDRRLQFITRPKSLRLPIFGEDEEIGRP